MEISFANTAPDVEGLGSCSLLDILFKVIVGFKFKTVPLTICGVTVCTVTFLTGLFRWFVKLYSLSLALKDYIY